jgi:hypothetical protein
VRRYVGKLRRTRHIAERLVDVVDRPPVPFHGEPLPATMPAP